MKHERIQKLMNLMRPLLPTASVSMFEEFIDEYKQLLDISEYSNELTANLREDKEKLRRQLVMKDEQIDEFGLVIEELKKELSDYLEKDYEREKQKVEICNIRDQLTKRVNKLIRDVEKIQAAENEAKKQNQSLKIKNKKLRVNNSFIRVLHKRAIREIENAISKEEHQAIVESIKKEKEKELEIAKHEIEGLQAEIEKMKEQHQYNFATAYKQGRFEHQRKRRY